LAGLWKCLGGSTQGTDRHCWLRERFSGSSVGRPWPLPCVGEELLPGRFAAGGRRRAALWCAEGQSWPGVCGVGRVREVDGSTVARWLRERISGEGGPSVASFFGKGWGSPAGSRFLWGWFWGEGAENGRDQGVYLRGVSLRFQGRWRAKLFAGSGTKN